jgi:acyl-CoA synthetase (AMP-forming)/AMP-acid ligase II
MDTPIASNSLCLGALPVRHARYRPHHTAVIVAARGAGEPEIRLDWREFNAYVNRWANALARLGVTRGDRVASVLPNGLELLATYWAAGGWLHTGIWAMSTTTGSSISWTARRT